MRFENLLLSVVLGLLVALPLLEAVLRKTLHGGVANSAAIVQHLTLVVGMLGAAVAARENRLLVLSRLRRFLTEPWRKLAAAFAGSCAVAVTVLLTVAGMDFALAERPSGQVLAYGIQVWVVQSSIPIGFGLIALRLAGHAAETWRGRAMVVSLAAVWLLLWQWSPMSVLVVLGVATLAGVPAFVTLAGVSLVLFKQAGEPIASIPIAHYSLVTNAILPTIPMFTLAGFVLAEGGAPQRLVRVFQAVFGRLRGGLPS